MARTSYLARRDGRYFMRARFAVQYAPLIGKRLYRAVLGTSDYRVARSRFICGLEEEGTYLKALSWGSREFVASYCAQHPEIQNYSVRYRNDKLHDLATLDAERLATLKKRCDEFILYLRLFDAPAFFDLTKMVAQHFACKIEVIGPLRVPLRDCTGDAGMVVM